MPHRQPTGAAVRYAVGHCLSPAWPIRWGYSKLGEGRCWTRPAKDETPFRLVATAAHRDADALRRRRRQHLAQVYLALDARLSEEKRAWLLEDGAELVANLCRESDPREAYREVKLELAAASAAPAVLRELCAWREEQARQRKLAAQPLLRERTLWPLARLLPKNKTDLAAIEQCIRAPCARTATSSSN